MTDRKPLAPVVAGTGFGFLAAICYTAANMALRDLSRPGDVDWAAWVTHWKALPAAVVALLLIARHRWNGRSVMPSAPIAIRLLIAAFIMQFCGNLMFQVALGMSGLVLTVPVCFATLITSGAALSRVLLGEPITPRSLVAMALLILSIAVLSVGGEGRAAEQLASVSNVVGAVVAASIAGFGYGLSGVIIRQSLNARVPLSATLVFFSVTGWVALGLWTCFRVGWVEQWHASNGALSSLLIAGIANCVAFFSVGAALERISVVHVNLLNASQIALCAIAGVVFFREAISIWVVTGIVLTISGLIMMDRNSPASDENESAEAVLLADVPESETVATNA